MRAEPFQIHNFIDGEFVEPVGGNYLDNIEPATGKPYSQVPDSDAADVDLAVAAAEKAFADWSRKPAAERSTRRAVSAKVCPRYSAASQISSSRTDPVRGAMAARHRSE